jgi:hypothetical protein
MRTKPRARQPEPGFAASAPPLVAWLLLWPQARRRRPKRPLLFRAWRSVLTLQTIALVNAVPAWASGTKAAINGSLVVPDSTGLISDSYYMSFDEGGLLHPKNGILSTILDMQAGLVNTFMGVVARLIAFGDSGEWNRAVAPIVSRLNATSSDFAAQMAVGSGALILSGFIMFIRSLDGDAIRAKNDFWYGILITILNIAFLTNPLGVVAGPDGLLHQADDAADWVSYRLTKHNDGNVAPRFATATIRRPNGKINFSIDPDSVSKQCGDAYTRGIKTGDSQAPRNMVRDNCKADGHDYGADMYAYSGHPSGRAIGNEALLAFLDAILAWFVLKTIINLIIRGAVSAQTNAALTPAVGPTAAIPGPPRRAWMRLIKAAALGVVVYWAGRVILRVAMSVFDQTLGQSGDPMMALFSALILVYVLLSIINEILAFAQGRESPFVSTMTNIFTINTAKKAHA